MKTFTRSYIVVGSLVAVLIIVMTGACTGIVVRDESDEELYRRVMNLSLASVDIQNFSVPIKKGIYTRAHFNYVASDDYIEMLLQHDGFQDTQHYMNKTFTLSSCSITENLDNWDVDITTDNKQCYEGLYFPYIHDLIYDPSSGQVEHFVEEIIRD